MNADRVTEKAASALIAANGRALCITADKKSAAQLREAVASQIKVNEPLLMPSVVPWQNLRAAVMAKPQESERRIIDMARLLPVNDGKWQKTARIYAEHFPDSFKANGGMRLAGALSDLFKEMDEYDVLDNAASLPDRIGEGGAGADFSFEAHLINNIHEALNVEKDKAALDDFARKLSLPLIFLCANAQQPTPAQQRFINLAGKREVFCDERSAEEEYLRAALSAEGAKKKSKITCDRCEQYPAPSLADAAKAALGIVRSFLAKREEGEKIGVVVYDRLLARRLRALAENAGVLIADSTGWRAATLSCGAALAEAAASFASPFDANEAETLLHPPFWRALTNDEHAAMQSEWRAAINKAARLPNSWGEVGDLCESENALCDAARQLQNDDGAGVQCTAGEWLRFLRGKFAPLLEAYDEDVAAQEMFARITAAGGVGKMRAGEFCAWLRLFLRGEYFPGEHIDSPVVFLPPGASAESCAKVLLLGANGDTLPAVGGGAFGEKTRAALGLPLRREIINKQRDDFCRLAARRENLSAVWIERTNKGEHVAPSPFWDLFAGEVKRCKGEVATIDEPAADENENIAADILPPLRAEVLLRELPESVRVTDTQTLMQCPYRFFTRAVLHLREDESETELTSSLEGRILHEALHKWAATDGSEEEWRKALRQCIDKKYRPRQSLEEHCWLQNSTSLLQWEKQRREDGWKIDSREKSVEVFVRLTPKAGVKLRGRIDRTDKRGEETVLIDYKRRASVTQEKFESGEDPQLPLYAFLSGCPDAKFVICQPIKTDGKVDKELNADASGIAGNLCAVAKQAARGKPLPANGATETCQKCEARRLCRKDHWL